MADVQNEPELLSFQTFFDRNVRARASEMVNMSCDDSVHYLEEAEQQKLLQRCRKMLGQATRSTGAAG